MVGLSSAEAVSDIAEAAEEILGMIDAELDQRTLRIDGRHSDLNSYSILSKAPLAKKKALVEAASRVNLLNRAMGSMCGMAVGDALGHPLEFLPAQNSPRPDSPHFDLSTMTFHRELNTFRLKRGQWTDDAAMGLCMADSFLIRRTFDGGDMRVRFWCWWFRGYNNAFRKERGRSGSIGLGGNIAKSLEAISGLKERSQVPPAFEAGNEDAGNGSLMRFAPVPLFMHAADARTLDAVSRQSSYTTHAGIIAAEACSFLAHLITSALRLPQGEPTCVRAFLDAAAEEYLTVSGLAGRSGWGHDQIKWLVTSTPVSAKERCWNWKAEHLDVEGTLRARGAKYNGYPVWADYFGSYAPDGLAMALWSVYHSRSFDEAVERSVNLLGDADSHGSITGQLAGAIYGYRSIHPQFLEWLAAWDDHDFAVRAVLLSHLGSAATGCNGIGSRKRGLEGRQTEVPAKRGARAEAAAP